MGCCRQAFASDCFTRISLRLPKRVLTRKHLLPGKQASMASEF